MELHGSIIVVDLPQHDIMAVNDFAEIVFEVGIVALIKLVEGADLGDELRHRLLTEGLDTLGQHDATAAPSPAEAVVEGADLGCMVGLVHGVLSFYRRG